MKKTTEPAAKGCLSPWTMLARLKILCQGRPDRITPWLDERGPWNSFCVLVIVLGAGLYGATIGLWRSPLQGLFTAAKFPLLVLLTTLGNAALNGMLAQALGLPLTFRQTSQVILMSFTLAALMLGVLSPVTLFLIYNTPPLGTQNPAGAIGAHNFTLLSHVFLIALAGIVANTRLWQLLSHLSGTRLADRILFSWLAGNLFLGSQLSWIMRPFIGSPGLNVEFFRDDALSGNFFESLWRAFTNLLS